VSSSLARRLLALFLLLHGVAHLVGVTSALDAIEGPPAEYLAGAWTVEAAPALYTIAVAWAIAAAAYALAAAWTWTGRRGWPTVMLAVTLYSLVLSTVALPMAIAGVVIDIVLLGVVVLWRTGTAP
jgi:hypothetical protein